MGSSIISMLVGLAVVLQYAPARGQSATVPGLKPSEHAIPPDVIFPDGVVCNVTSPDGIQYRTIFYKSQTISFAHEPNNAAEYGTTFIRNPNDFDPSVVNKWRLQLGQPGAITQLSIPPGFTSSDCPIGKPIRLLAADKQILQLFVPQ